MTSIAELNRLFTAWAETVYHRRIHSETGQAPLQRWADGWAGTMPPLPAPGQLHEAFLWSERRTVRKTATVSLHGNTYQAGPSLTGRKVELIFDSLSQGRDKGSYADLGVIPMIASPGRSGTAGGWHNQAAVIRVPGQ